MSGSLPKQTILPPIHPSESQDICFIHDNDVSGFILEKQKMMPKQGNIVDMNGIIMGRHNGLHKFTIGQRRGIDCPASEPYYVKHIDLKTNTLIICFKKDLSTKQFQVNQINWNFSDQSMFQNIITKIRYSHPGALSTLNKRGNCGEVIFNEPQNAVTPGQTAVFYKNSRVLGAGMIQ